MKLNLKHLCLSTTLFVSFLATAAVTDPAPTGFVDTPNAMISKPQQITFEGPKSGEGYFSADGKKMIFQSERHPGNPFYQMYLMNLETGKTDLISSGKGKTTCGWIHPSEKKLLFSSTHKDPEWQKKQNDEIELRKKPVKGRYSWSFDDQYDIFTSDLKGKNLKQLTKAPGYDAEGSYSPDGKWIVFASNRAGYIEKLSPEDQKMFQQDPSYMMDIYLMKEDGSNVKRLTEAKGYDGGPFFSADGKHITWRRFSTSGATAEIYTMNVDGSDQKPVTQLKSMSWAPFYHPSGDYIVFASSVLGYANFELFIVDSAGSKKPVRVTFGEGFDGLASFSPDGQKITWSHRSEKGESQIYIADWDDALARQLLGLPATDLEASSLRPAISASDAKAIVTYLASEKMAGRRTGSEEEKVYTQKIADLFKSFGLKGAATDGTFFEKFDFTSGVKLGAGNKLEFVGGFKKALQVEKDYNVMSFSKTGKISPAPIVFAGFGLKAPATDKFPAYDSYKNVDAKQKWVVVLKDTPQDISAEHRQHFNTYARIQHKVTVAKNEGAVGIIFVDPTVQRRNDNEDFKSLKFEGTLSDSSLAVAKVQQSILKDLIKLSGQDFASLLKKLNQGEVIEPVIIPKVYLSAEIALDFEKARGINVVAKLPAKAAGSAKAVLIAAHGDHLGHGEVGSSLAKGEEKGQVHFGADDNASGVAGVLELAHYFSDQAKKPGTAAKKDIYFAVWSGEEIGLLGSTAFVNAWGKTNKKKISEVIGQSLNMDMIGKFQDKLLVQGVGSGDAWSRLSEEIAVKEKLPLVLQEDPYLPTDSMALYIAQIPSISFFTGAHSEYHSPRDRAETLNYEGLEKVIKTVGEYTHRLTEAPNSKVNYVKVGGDPQSKLEGRSFRTYLGTVPDYAQEGVKGVRVSGVSKGSPADQAGLQEKDVIVEFNKVKIENIYDYVYTLQSVPANIETTMKVERAGGVKELKITPKLKD
jgi:Tol biopolymer transport system component/putative aminopeptidase FrvX